MTTSRLAILLALMLAGLSSVYLLPKQLGYMPVGVVVNLPEGLGEWWGREIEVTQHEHDVLGADTQIARKEYSNGRGDSVLVSMVLAGEDMMTGIHRPERCLPAQGWAVTPGGSVAIDVPGEGRLPATRLKNHRTEQRRGGVLVPVENVCYYWFAGSSKLTASHTERVWMDTVDRVGGGYVQRWAMMMVAANITAGQSKFGRDEKAVNEMLEGFISQLAPRIHNDAVRYR
ncbi:MAG: exosortase C-terminal domain/associated protein EpsI [Chthoniobacteraceae bacterium]